MKHDNVNHPRHYEPLFFMREPECIDFTELMSFNRGNAFKYVWRSGLKGDIEKEIEDLKKASWYLNRGFGKVDNDTEKNVIVRNLWDFVKVPEDNSPRYSKYLILDAIVRFNFAGACAKIKDRIDCIKRKKVEKTGKSENLS